MRSLLGDSLRHAAVTTFEQVVFLLPDMPPDEQQRARQVRAIASIAFSGPAVGLLQVRACEGLLPRLLANMVGQEIENETLQLDALGEIANIICGQIFPHLDPVSVFQQNPPQVAVCTSATFERVDAPTARIDLGLESSRAEIVLWLYGDAA